MKSSRHDDVQYHRMTAQNDGFVDMQVTQLSYGQLKAMGTDFVDNSLNKVHPKRFHGKPSFCHLHYLWVEQCFLYLVPSWCPELLTQRQDSYSKFETSVYNVFSFIL